VEENAQWGVGYHIAPRRITKVLLKEKLDFLLVEALNYKAQAGATSG
jgi:hypothetical protein